MIAISGSSGFIGRALFERFTHRGSNCFGYSRTAALGFHYTSDYSDLPAVETIIHCAQPALASAWSPKVTEECFQVLSNLLKSSFDRFVFLSSAEVYADGLTGLAMEESELNADSPYRKAKIEMEELVLERRGTCVVRLSNVYGPPPRRGTVIGDLHYQIIRKPGRILLDSGYPVRDFMFIDDAVDGICLIADSDLEGVVNLGTGRGTSIAQLAKFALRAYGLPDDTKISYRNNSSSDNSHRVLDMSVMKSKFNWTPNVSIEQGLGLLLETE
jgi:UDP-glucose 4-epimerase